MALNKRSNAVHFTFPVVEDEAHLRGVLLALNRGEGPFAPMSWRRIAETLPRLPDGKHLNRATLCAYAHNSRPIVNREHRKVLGLGPRYPYRHLKIRTDNVESAYSSMVNNLDAGYLLELSNLLTEWKE